ncbi:MAG: sugar phosphate isomerase/epimerase [Proteobacteria bacterium]|nr:sugar phosphate isomerase/epimerase [Pseudomonadota bacterium]
MNWEALIGVPTTLMMEGGSESEAKAIPSIVDQIRKSGFQTIEIVPAQFHPLTERDAALFLETTFGERERKKLREPLKPFQVVTVHGSNIAIEVAECSAGREEDPWRPYIELMRFARDIGARIVTFHKIRRQEKADLSDGEMAEYHIKFGKLAAGYAQEWNLIAGFELANDIKFFRENEIINRIGSERFGLLLDIGHIALQFAESPGITDCVLEIIMHFMGRIIEFHAGGLKNIAPWIRTTF